MNRKEFLKKVKAYAKANDLEYVLDKGKGKGGHWMVYVGKDGLTTVKDGEFGPGLLASMCKDLGIKKRDL